MNEKLFDLDYIIDLLDKAPDELETQVRGFIRQSNVAVHLILIERDPLEKQLFVKHYVFPNNPDLYEWLDKAYWSLAESHPTDSEFKLAWEALTTVLARYLVLDEVSDGF